MKKHILSLFIAVFVFGGLTQANVVTGQAAIPDGYYSGVDGKSSAESILDALFAKIKDHTVISYNALEDYYEQTDFYSDTVWDIFRHRVGYVFHLSLHDGRCEWRTEYGLRCVE